MSGKILLGSDNQFYYTSTKVILLQSLIELLVLKVQLISQFKQDGIFFFEELIINLEKRTEGLLCQQKN